MPQNLDFSQWLGPTPVKYYTEMRVHPQEDYSRPGWLRHEAHCLGMITGWGSHHYDTMHWALEFENTGPSHVEGKGEFPPRGPHLERARRLRHHAAVSEERGGERLRQVQHRPQVLRRRRLDLGDARRHRRHLQRSAGQGREPAAARCQRSEDPRSEGRHASAAGEQGASQELAARACSRARRRWRRPGSPIAATAPAS